MAEVDDGAVDRVALAIAFGSVDRQPARANAFRLAWEAWGTWANGGFDGVFANPSADHVEDFIDALRAVGAGEHAALFHEAVGVFPSGVHGFDGCYAFLASGTADAEMAAERLRSLDDRMAALTPISTVLSEVLRSDADLRSLDTRTD